MDDVTRVLPRVDQPLPDHDLEVEITFRLQSVKADRAQRLLEDFTAWLATHDKFTATTFTVEAARLVEAER